MFQQESQQTTLPDEQIDVHVEVCVRLTSTCKPSIIESSIRQHLQSKQMIYKTGYLFSAHHHTTTTTTNMDTNTTTTATARVHDNAHDEEDEAMMNHNELIHQHVKYIYIDTVMHDSVLYWQAQLKIFVFQLHDDNDTTTTTMHNNNNNDMMMENNIDEDDVEEIVIDEQEQISACRQYILPSVRFVDTWDSLMFDDSETKYNLLNYASSAMLFSDSKINTHLISWNRVMLLHGPPGTGKTSLCKALAQKLSIHLCSSSNSNHHQSHNHMYSHGQLIEINTHSLFSKWFSESGKLVFKLFQHVQQMVQDEDAFVCVLIDEVESLTAARQSALNGTEPSDSIRVVNAVLTQLDQLKRYRNVLILTTSNITGAIDIAFVDRADLKQYIGPPGIKARFHIIKSCLTELMRVNLITTTTRGSSLLLDQLTFEAMMMINDDDVDEQNTSRGSSNGGGDNGQQQTTQLCLSLFKQLCNKCDGFSGRSLRKLPFMAHAFFIQLRQCTLDVYLRAMIKAADKELKERSYLDSAKQ